MLFFENDCHPERSRRLVRLIGGFDFAQPDSLGLGLSFQSGLERGIRIKKKNLSSAFSKLN
ncbi:hypothetical protein AB674_08005 [Flavobacterium sp. ABG]|nr:hypothetical protein AB674_08005 [Flavobacterium sp. ABG]